MSPSSLTYRIADPSDAAGILAIHLSAIAAVDPAIYANDVKQSWAHGLTVRGYVTAMTAGEDFEIAIDQTGQPLAFCSILHSSIAALFVCARAQERGIGRALLARGEQRILRRWPDTKTVLVSASLNAMPFYERNGLEIPIAKMQKAVARTPHGGAG